MTPADHHPKVHKATLEDAEAIHRLLSKFAARGEVIPRSLPEIYERIREFWVAEQDARLIGCVALHIYWKDLAEIRSLAIQEPFQGKGFGKKLVDACIKEAKALGLRKLFTLTNKEKFFVQLGFRLVDKQELPQKIWRDCLECAKFPDCDESALVLNLFS